MAGNLIYDNVADNFDLVLVGGARPNSLRWITAKGMIRYSRTTRAITKRSK